MGTVEVIVGTATRVLDSWELWVLEGKVLPTSNLYQSRTTHNLESNSWCVPQDVVLGTLEP